MKHLFLQNIRVIEENIEQTPVQEKEETDIFDDSFYDNIPADNIVSNIDDFTKYNISLDQAVTHKEARTDTEERKPFIISKTKSNKNSVDWQDTIYKSTSKMKITDRDVQRIGFIIANKKPKEIKLKERRKHKYRGIANDSFLIYKKKPFNFKKIGYLQLRESTNTKDLYVEVIANKGYKWLVYLLVFMMTIGLYFSLKDWEGWHFDISKLKLYKISEMTEYKENDLSVTFNAAPVCRDGKVNIGISSEYIEDINYTIELYDENESLIYESNRINSGDTINEIELTQIPATGSHSCILKCHSYKNNRYMGSIESNLTLDIQ